MGSAKYESGRKEDAGMRLMTVLRPEGPETRERGKPKPAPSTTARKRKSARSGSTAKEKSASTPGVVR
jgi:hypothetical protein